MAKAGTKYLGNPRILDRAVRSESKPCSRDLFDVARQPRGVQDTAQWIEDAQHERMERGQPDPLSGTPQETGPAHLKARWGKRPAPPFGMGPEGANAGEG